MLVVCCPALVLHAVSRLHIVSVICVCVCVSVSVCVRVSVYNTCVLSVLWHTCSPPLHVSESKHAGYTHTRAMWMRSSYPSRRPSTSNEHANGVVGDLSAVGDFSSSTKQRPRYLPEQIISSPTLYAYAYAYVYVYVLCACGCVCVCGFMCREIAV